MTSIRKKFHELGNWHNNISMAAIVTKEDLHNCDVSESALPDIKKMMEKTIKNLNKIEKFVAAADDAVNVMKPFIYEKIGADTEIRRI